MAQPDELVPYAFKPGQSGNPGGRPKGLARRVRDAVPDLDLIEFQMAVLYLKEDLLAKWDIKRGEVRLSDRQDAHKWLTERAWGKAAPLPEVQTDDPLELDVSESAIGRIVDELAPRREKTVAGPVADRAVAADGEGGAASTAG